MTPLAALYLRAFAEKRLFDAIGPLDAEPCRRLASALAASDVRPRQGVAVCFDNGRSCIETYIALAMLDAVAVPLPATLPDPEREALWNSLGCSVLIDANGIHQRYSGPSMEEPLWPDDVQWVMHSSGSTGVPKAIPITYAAVETNAADVMRFLGIDGQVTHLGSMSQCYTNGLFNSFLLPLITGGKVCLGPVAGVVNLGAFRETLRAARASVLWVNPAVVMALTRRGAAADVAEARVLVSCTAPLDQQTCLAAEATLARPVLQSYGLVETLIVTIEHPNRSAASEFSAGQPVSGVKSVRRRWDGQLEIENGAVTPGYARRDGRGFAINLPEGESGRKFIASDFVEFTSDGRLQIHGRASAVINVGGVKVSAEQLEQALRAWPGVNNAAVVPVQWGNGLERPGVMMEAIGDLDFSAIADHCVRVLGRAARPADIRLVEEIPLTANGKIDRRAVAALMQSPPR